MKTLYKHVHLVVDDKREYLDGSILINDGIIEDVFVQSNKTIEESKEIDMKGKIFIPSFFDTKSKKEKQKGVTKRFVCSDKEIDEPTHLITDDEVEGIKNIYAVTRINKYQKVNSIKTFISPSSEQNIFADGVSDITKEMHLDLNSKKMINYAFDNNCFVEFGIDNKLNDNYINLVFKNIDINKIMLISYDHDNIIDQVKKLNKLNIPLTHIVAITSINPYQFYENSKLNGSLIKGKPANIVCLNEKMEYEFTLLKGERDA